MAMAKLTAKLIQQATRAAEKLAELNILLTEAFTERYGVTYSDVDCDELIDAFEYHGGDSVQTVADCDRLMLERGVHVLVRNHDR